jgi:probable HAF family extracellular repeat protein/VCBS repeat-containing protein
MKTIKHMRDKVVMLRMVMRTLPIVLCLMACSQDDANETLMAVDDQVTTARGVVVTVVVLNNDADTNGSELTVVEVTQATHGTVTLNADGTVTYTPQADFDGSDHFGYTLSNAREEVAAATVTVTVLPESGIVLLGRLYLISPVAFEAPYQPIVMENLGLNDNGQIVGWYSGIDPLPFLYDNGVIQRLHVGPSAVANDINNGGQIVGGFSGCYFTAQPVINRGFLLSGNGEPIPIDFPGLPDPTDPSLCLESYTYAYGINDTGQVVGSFRHDGNTHGFLMNGDVFTQLDMPGATATIPDGINNAGQIVGTFTDARGTHGFLMDGDRFTQLDVPGATSTHARDINDVGQIVGTLIDAAGPHGFLMEGDAFAIFNIPGSAGTRGEGINNLGQIAGSFWVPQEPPDTGVFTRAYVATPVAPDPAALFKP